MNVRNIIITVVGLFILLNLIGYLTKPDDRGRRPSNLYQPIYRNE